MLTERDFFRSGMVPLGVYGPRTLLILFTSDSNTGFIYFQF
jgi:hypothetical protein